MSMSSVPMSRRQLLIRTGIAGAAAAAGAAGLLKPSIARATVGPQSYTASWSSVDQHPPAPQWFQDAKFGIYFHWGVFSVPAFSNEWYPRNMYNSGSAENQHHIATYGDPSVWPYHYFMLGAANKAGQFTKFAAQAGVRGRQLRPQRLGTAVQAGRGQVRRPGRRAPRRLLDVEQPGERVELGQGRARVSTCWGCTPRPSALRA